MKFYALNGSPRKKNNTATLLQKTLDGIRDTHDDDSCVEMIHLYDLKYRGCISCFHCKRLGGKSYGKCIAKDDLTPVLEKLATADGIIFGSPIYFGDITGMLRCLIERLLFQYFVYDANYSSLAPKKMPTAFIYTMNVTEEVMHKWQYPQRFQLLESYVGNIFTPPEILYAYNTYQFPDYSKYKCDCFSEKDKAAHRENFFPVDCEKAYQLGQKLAKYQP